MSKTEDGNTTRGLITGEDRPALAESGHQPAPAPGASRQELKAAVTECVRNQMSLMSEVKTAKDAGKLGKIAADKLTDAGKKIEDKATQDLGKAEREKHAKDNKDKADKGKTTRARDLGVPVHALISALQQARAER